MFRLLADLYWYIDFKISKIIQILLGNISSGENKQTKYSRDPFEKERYDLINDYLPMNVYHDD
ncbi:MAG: hypothetical protein K2P99_04700 [Burkholderiales bacterium]|nr:hypothetical protein [Burkholderiales bacterium]